MDVGCIMYVGCKVESGKWGTGRFEELGWGSLNLWLGGFFFFFFRGGFFFSPEILQVEMRVGARDEKDARVEKYVCVWRV